MTVAGREEGAPPPVDLAAERRNGEFVASLIQGEKVNAFHDLSDGGLALALAEMAMAREIGASVEAEGLEHAFFFRRGPGALRLDGAAGPPRRDRRGREARQCSALAHRPDRRKTLRLGGAAHCPCGLTQSL